MEPLKDCLIGPELASAIRKIFNEFGVAVPKSKKGFRCPRCNQPVRASISDRRKLAPHFEHYAGNRKNCR